jgi:ribosomal protein L37AE/L43A
MRIDEKLYRETSSHDIPLENKRETWQRLDCPYCGHKRAVINYGANWFQCWACGVKRSGYTEDSESLAIVRFARQIEKAVKKVKGSFGAWLNGSEDEIANVAAYRVWNYSAGELGEKYDAGKLPEWEAECNAEEEPWRLEAKVQSVLDRDMMDWARGQKRWKEHNQSVGSMLGDDTDQASAVTGLVTEGLGYRLREREANIAVKYGIKYTHFCSKEPPGTKLTGPMNYGPLRRCDLMRNGVGPIAGHCPWCNKRLGLPTTCPPEAIDLYHDDDYDLRRRYPYLVATTIDGLPIAEIAEQQGISATTVNRRLAREKAQFRLAA